MQQGVLRVAQSTEREIEAYCNAYRRRDFAACLDLFEDDVFSGLAVDRGVIPFGRLSFGKAAVLRRFRAFDAMFEADAFELTRVSCECPDKAWSRIYFRSYHRETGAELDGNLNIHWMFRDGRVMRALHYHDRPRFEAFFRMLPPSRRHDC